MPLLRSVYDWPSVIIMMKRIKSGTKSESFNCLTALARTTPTESHGNGFDFHTPEIAPAYGRDSIDENDLYGRSWSTPTADVDYGPQSFDSPMSLPDRRLSWWSNTGSSRTSLKSDPGPSTTHAPDCPCCSETLTLPPPIEGEEGSWGWFDDSEEPLVETPSGSALTQSRHILPTVKLPVGSPSDPIVILDEMVCNTDQVRT